MTLSDGEYLSTSIGIAMSGGDGHPFTARSFSQYGSDVQQWDVAVVPASFEWSSTHLTSGRTESFDPATLSLNTDGSVLRLTPDRIPCTFPDQVKLAFPLSLPIWGRPRDEYHPVSVEDHEEGAVLLLRHSKDPGLFGSLTFDRASGRARRLATPSTLLLMRVESPASLDDDEHSFGFVSGAPESAKYLNLFRAHAHKQARSQGGDIDADE